ncbi:MAG: hypothetical protein ABI670_19670 [Chloroflexota bacterium]
MTWTHTEAWAVQKMIVSRLQADAVLWENIDGRVFDEAIPKGMPANASYLYAIVRTVEEPQAYGRYSSNNGCMVLPVWRSYLFDVFVTRQDESYGDVLASTAARIFAALDRTREYGTDGDYIVLNVVKPIHRRYSKDGRVYKEMGHRIRALVRTEEEPWTTANEISLIWTVTLPAPNIYVIGSYCDSVVIDYQPNADGTLKEAYFRCAGLYGEHVTLEDLPAHFLGGTSGVLDYGPNGNNVGQRRIWSDDAKIIDFHWIHDDLTGPMRWAMTMYAAGLSIGSFTDPGDG